LTAVEKDFMQAYTYTIRHLPTNKLYYGVRKSTVLDIGIKYFSSSKLIKRMLSEEPLINFEFKVRRKFLSYNDARAHESKLLSRIKAVSNTMMLNQAVSSPRLCSKDPIAEIQRRKSISKAMKQLWSNPTYKENQSFNKLSSDERSTRGKAGALKRTANYASGKTLRKPKKAKSYKDVVLVKDDVLKTVKSNQVPAYAKSGWTRL
jgi:hypothetical protein